MNRVEDVVERLEIMSNDMKKMQQDMTAMIGALKDMRLTSSGSCGSPLILDENARPPLFGSPRASTAKIGSPDGAFKPVQ